MNTLDGELALSIFQISTDFMETKASWVPVPSYESFYLIHPYGLVKSLHKRNQGMLMKTTIRRGYYTVQLSNKLRTTTKYVHRLVADAFIPKPEGKDFINHINGDRLDNRVGNLEWVTAAENMQHAFTTGLCSGVGVNKPVVNICTGERFKSAKEAAQHYAVNYKTLLSSVLNHPENPYCLQYETP